MICRHCLWYALDRWTRDGGYLMLRRSHHWDCPHALHLDEDGIVSHCRPDETLPRPWHSLTGFVGHVEHTDEMPDRAISPRGVVLGAALLLVLAVWWWIARSVRGLG